MATKSAKNAVELRPVAAPNFDPEDLPCMNSQWCENYSDLFPRSAKITATNHHRFAQFLARTLEESRNSKRTFQRFREAPAAHSGTKTQF
jgi:hypothetical protein